MKRRYFLKNTFKAASAATFAGSMPVGLLSRVAQAQSVTSDTTNLVVIRLHGAFDALQGLNPWTDALPAQSDLFVSYDPAVSGTIGDYKTVIRNAMGTQINLGPSAHALAKHADKMAVINGIWMGPVDLGHPFAVQHMTSGRTQERAPALAASIASTRLKQDQFLVINGPIEAAEFQLKILQTINLKNGLVSSGDDGAAGYVDAYQRQASHLSGHRAFTQNKARIDRFNQVLTSLKPGSTSSTDRSSGGITPGLQTFARTELDDLTAVAALSSGLSTIVQLDWQQGDGGSPDNHVLYREIHPAAQRNRWDRLSRFIDRLEAYHLLKTTLVMVLTEFSRTPAMNSNFGKDHNYFDNSCLLIGAGINGGTVIGGHRLFGVSDTRNESQLSGDFIDFGSGTGNVYRPASGSALSAASQSVPRGVDLIRPADVIRTAIEIVGPSLGDSLGSEAKILPRILAKKAK